MFGILQVNKYSPLEGERQPLAFVAPGWNHD